MKKILFFCLIALFASCSAEEELQGMSAESTAMLKELENVTNGYELMIKGYSLEEIQREKDETPQEKEAVTFAKPWMIKAIQDSLSKTALNYGSKTRADAQPYGGSADRVGLFKATTCGNYREFIYHMDCQDGGNTRGGAGATVADGNVTFYFCLVEPGNYGGGTLLFYNYQWNYKEGNVDVVKRYHDNEDKRNANEIRDNGGLASTGLSVFSHNTCFFWRFSEKPRRVMPFKYGVLRNSGAPTSIIQQPPRLIIDDENSSNGNEAIVWVHTTHFNNTGGITSPPRKMNSGETFRGIAVTTDGNTEYTLDFYDAFAI